MSSPLFEDDYLKCQEIWEQLAEAEQDFARQLGAILWKAEDAVIIDNTRENPLFLRFSEKDIIVKKDGGWQFALSCMQYFTQSLNIIHTLSLSEKPPAEVLQQIIGYRREREDVLDNEDRKHLITYVLIHLVNSFRRNDLLDVIIASETTDRLYWQYHDYICRVLPALELSVEDFAVLLKGLVTRVRRDLAGTQLYSAASHLGHLRPDLALDLVQYFVDNKEWVVLALIESLITGVAFVSDQYLEMIVRLCNGWLKSDIDSLRQTGLYGLQNLALGGKYDPQIFLEQIKQLIPEHTGAIVYALSIVVTRLGAKFSPYSNECLQILRQLKSVGAVEDVNHGIAIALSGDRVNTIISYTKACLDLLADTPEKNKGTIQQISGILYQISHSSPIVVWQFLESWVLTHDREESIAEYDLYLSDIQYSYQHDPDLGVTVLTKWFGSTENYLVEEAREVIRELGVRAFAGQVIRQLTAEGTVYISEKLLIGHFEGQQLIGLFYSIVRETSHFTTLAEYFSEILNHLAWVYPGAFTDVSRQIIQQSENKEAVNLYEHSFKNLEIYHEQHRIANHLFKAELAPSKSRSDKFQEYERRRMQKLSRSVMDSDRFPLQKFLPKVMIGRGDRSFHMDIFHPDPTQRRTFSSPEGFGHFSQTFELPRGEFLDPEGELRSRLQRLSLKPGDVQLGNK